MNKNKTIKFYTYFYISKNTDIKTSNTLVAVGLNQGNYQNKHNQEVWCKYHKSNGHSSVDCRDKTVNQNNPSFLFI